CTVHAADGTTAHREGPMAETSAEIDVVLIGGGIMSATLGVLLNHVRPDWSIAVYERLDRAAAESSDPWNNAGTGHAALCELNYTPQRADGSIDVTKAVRVNEQFHQSRQFWASLIDQQLLPEPRRFISPVPHLSYVGGEDDVAFLRKRYEALVRIPLFASLRMSDDVSEIERWVPLMMEGRDLSVPLLFTRSDDGTDVNFGALTKYLIEALVAQGAEVAMRHEVDNLVKQPDGRWSISVTDLSTGERKQVTARFVFIGGGGRAIHLLQRSGIPEAKGYGGFPVGGQWLRSRNPALTDRHKAKVYGKSTVNAPPMAMPHLDLRMIDGKPGLLFGPYAGFSPKFLKHGALTDLPRSIRRDNILTLLTVAKDELPLTLYLIRQALQSNVGKIETLRNFVPTAQEDDWELVAAGQRVQTMKSTRGKRGVLEFGTEVVSTRDGSLAGLLGASPGASTAVSIMLDVMERCFSAEYPGWQGRLRELIPSVGTAIAENPALLEEIQASTDRTLQLKSAVVAT
ncbi:MAG TPA: malate dehydrogenase (quinone), partial [Thermomicrobiales bacterium]|nr:malate dehydrogenase (quinone) [Thermomicrobiales bacterium]